MCECITGHRSGSGGSVSCEDGGRSAPVTAELAVWVTPWGEEGGGGGSAALMWYSNISSGSWCVSFETLLVLAEEKHIIIQGTYDRMQFNTWNTDKPCVLDMCCWLIFKCYLFIIFKKAKPALSFPTDGDADDVTPWHVYRKSSITVDARKQVESKSQYLTPKWMIFDNEITLLILAWYNTAEVYTKVHLFKSIFYNVDSLISNRHTS